MQTPHGARRPLLRHLTVFGAAAVAAAALALPAAGSDGVAGRAAGVTNPVTPGNFTGYGFDQCLAPTQKAMDAWLSSSPFWAVGIYISGNSRACRNQPNLTPAWVTNQLAAGWRLLPITLGPQAYCNPRYPKYKDDPVIRRDPADGYAAARAQGVAEATKAVKAATALGIVPGSTLWYDLEAFDINNKGCRISAMRFLSGWTEQLHVLDYVSGAYSSGASGIRAIDNARVNNANFTEPDMIWVADWSGKPWVFTGSWLRDDGFAAGRMHQYRGGHDEVHGGVRINIDSNFLRTGKGSAARPAKLACGGVQIDLASYPRLDVGAVHELATKAAQCLLRRVRAYDGPITGVYDDATGAAAAAYRVRAGLPRRTAFNRRLWTAVLSAGEAKPLMKYGAASPAVRRLQRALGAALNQGLAVTGVFEGTTTRAVKAYQGRVGLPVTGVVTDAMWLKLQYGVR